MRRRPGISRRGRATLLALHRQLGIVAALIVVALTITGLLINHAPALGLDQSMVAQSWILRLYNPNAAPQVHAFRAGETWAVWANGNVLLAGEQTAEVDAAPVGLADAGPVLVMAFPEQALVAMPDGRLVEALGAAALPGRVEAIAGRDDGRGVVVRTPEGCFHSDAAVVNWEPGDCAAAWSTPRPLPDAQRARLGDRLGGADIPWERVLLDLHSGRLFGRVGVWIVDLTGIALLILAGTGAVNWWTGRQGRRKGRYAGQTPPISAKQRRNEDT